MVRKVEVVPFSEQWSILFNNEAEKIKTVFGSELLNVYHIGSTSIPGICAKPIIDMLVKVKDIEKVDDYNGKMAEIGYEAMGEHGIPGRRFFRKGRDERIHHVHMFQRESEHITRHLAFKEYLIAHPEEAQVYSQLKQRLAEQFPTDIEAYIKGKDPFIKEIEKKALKWYAAQI